MFLDSALTVKIEAAASKNEIESIMII